MIEQYPKSKKIILLGTFPPPIGGVSVYLSRLSARLEKEGFEIIKWDISRGRFYFYYDFVKIFLKIITRKNYVLHLHALNIKYLLAAITLKYLTGIDVYITNHNISYFKSKTVLRQKLFQVIVKKADKIFVVNKHILQQYSSFDGIESKISVISPFLPPDEKEEEKIKLTYPKALFQFIENREPILLASASRLNFFNGNDLYGLDLCVKLTAELKEQFSRIGFIFAIGDENFNSSYLTKIKDEINRLNIKNNFFFLTGNKIIWPLFKKADLFLRPTNTDGFGVSIAEAIYFGTPAIASDVCPRPEGTILFKNRDFNDLYTKVNEILKGKKLNVRQ